MDDRDLDAQARGLIRGAFYGAVLALSVILAAHVAESDRQRIEGTRLTNGSEVSHHG